MYCGSCLRDSALARAIIRAGHHVSLIPLYTPIRTDEQDVSTKQVFYGGLNTWLQYAIGLIFRHTPRAIDKLFDKPWMLNFAGKLGANTPPSKLGPFTVSILKGIQGPQRKELRRLTEFLKNEIKPQIVTLPNAMFLGTAPYLREQLKVPIICELTGEDIFLDAMIDPWKTQARDLMREHTHHVDRFIANAFKILRTLPGMENAKLRAAGYLGKGNQKWFVDLQDRITRDGLAKHFFYEGEVDLPGKLAFLDSIDILSVPTAYQEAKGIFVLESLARGVPVVQPAHGSFRELIYTTGAGVLVPPNDPQKLAEALAELLRDPQRRRQLGEQGQRAVRREFTDDHMAEKMLQLYEELLQWRSAST